YDRMSGALSERRMGQVLDIVPNHMAIGIANVWWWDVLENGPASRWAAAFDIDWDTAGRSNQKVLLPFLGDHYGRVLEAGELKLDRDGGSFVVRYQDHVAPVCPRTLAELLGRTARLFGSDELASLAVFFGRLPPATAVDDESLVERHRDKEVLRSHLARLLDQDLHLARAVDGAVLATNEDHDALDALLERQNYRLAFWRTAGQELDYRRFFDVPTLIGLRIESRRIFAAAHETVLKLVKRLRLEGLRIDHIDGLRDPADYLRRLREQSDGAFVVVEKILARDETLPPTWPVAGTTGYDFLNVVGGLFVDPSAEEAFTELYREVTGSEMATQWEDVVDEGKNLVLRDVLAADVNRLVNLLVSVCERHRRYRDFTRRDLHDTVWEILACFPVYRSYARPDERPSAADVAAVEAAVNRAAERRPQCDPELFSFLRDLLLLRVPGDVEADFAVRFQQVTGPVMAKGVEDTAFYRYNRLVSLNDVGGEPGRFGTSVAEFHAHNEHMASNWPDTMLATSTHDTKRSEDVRARISLLSELPGEWADAVHRWTTMNIRHKTAAKGAGTEDSGGGGPRLLPDPNTEYLLYQTLVGAFPIDAERATAYMEKATREAKEQTSWIDPEPIFDNALRSFVESILADEAFTADLVEFVGPLVDPGRVVSLAQTLLKLTAPGIPDLYQGTEVWDLSLVDPDNRRPVAYATRRILLDKVRNLGADDVRALDDEGATKLWTTWKALTVRREQPEAFGTGPGPAGSGSYEPLVATG
ncbi:MAG TPA: malto-oligosyltrehalose synthase, partial [Acidimicrobiales bacterium]|nr:malto-oligosyltrehalose synthase [Acidimicrobiales bacterium]